MKSDENGDCANSDEDKDSEYYCYAAVQHGETVSLPGG